MFSSFASIASFALLLALQVRGHAIITPALGGGTARSDVQQPSSSSPCGKINIASNIDSSTAVPLSGTTLDATITNFNGGTDGSRQVTAQVDPTGTGKNFVAATVTTNGDKSPTDVGSQPLVIQAPAGTTCSGGASKDRCLFSFVTAGKFGNCVVASSGAGGAANAATAASNSTSTAASCTSNTAATSKKEQSKQARSFKRRLNIA